jgi:putative transposase
MTKTGKSVKQRKGQPSRAEGTPSFICELPLRVTASQERTLLTRLEAARQVYNACLGEATRRVGLIRQSKRFQQAYSLPKDDPTRALRFSEARAAYQFNDYALHAYAGTLRHSWLGQHLDSLTVQKIASRAYQTANKVLVGQAKRVRFKGKNQMDSVEGKNNTSGIRWCGNRVEWSGLLLPACLDPRDKVVAHGLASRVKYVRLVRRKIGEKNRFFAQLVCEGTPYRKERHQIGKGVVGLDLGTQTVAVVSEQHASLQMFCPAVTPNAKQLRRLGRKIDRQRRANNPEYYDEHGRVKKGAKKWKVSNRQKHSQALSRDYYRRLAATRKREHGRLVHQVLALGSQIHLENLSYRAWQKTFGKSVGLCAPGMFVAHLIRVAESAGGQVLQINARLAKLSQTCHCGAISKKPLSQRHHHCPCGVKAQRDLYSAYLARFVHPDSSLLDAGQAASAWPGSEPALQAAFEQVITNQPASGRTRPSSFGVRLRQSQSGSSATGLQANAKSQDAVALPKRRARAWKRQR